MHPLDRLVALESYQEILAILRPPELAVVALRLDGLLYTEIALLLGITERAVYYRLQGARDRLRAQGFGDKPCRG